jgi:hypothetical protein
VSVQAISWAWQQELPPNGKLVLIAIADNADDRGTNSWPSLETLARKTGYSSRQVKRIIDALVSVGVLSVSKAQLPNRRKDRQPNLYTLTMASEPLAIARSEWSTAGCNPDLRLEVIEAFDRMCAHCLRRGDDCDPDGHPWEVDRVKSGRDGGQYVRDNVVLSCRACNRRGDIMSSRDEGTSEEDENATGGHNEPDDGTPMSHEPPITVQCEKKRDSYIRDNGSVDNVKLTRQQVRDIVAASASCPTCDVKLSRCSCDLVGSQRGNAAIDASGSRWLSAVGEDAS